MIRDDLVEAGAAVWPKGTTTQRDAVALIIDVVEPLIRADERATIKYEMGVLQWEGLRLRQERADLRARVEALHPDWLGTPDDVLALLDGQTDD